MRVANWAMGSSVFAILAISFFAPERSQTARGLRETQTGARGAGGRLRRPLRLAGTPGSRSPIRKSREPGRWGQSGGGASPASEFGRYVNLSPDCRSYRPNFLLAVWCVTRARGLVPAWHRDWCPASPRAAEGYQRDPNRIRRTGRRVEYRASLVCPVTAPSPA